MVDAVAKKLKRLMAGVFNLPEGRIAEDTSMATLDSWDSLQHLNLILAVEEHFAVTFDADEIPAATSFVILRDLIVAKTGKGTR